MTKARALKIAGIVSGILAAVCAVLIWGPWIAVWWITKAAPQIGSLGIIGGADGPTSVYVATAVISTCGIWTTVLYCLEMILPLILAAVSVACFLVRKKILKKGE